jgi:hypothetical protein
MQQLACDAGQALACTHVGAMPARRSCAAGDWQSHGEGREIAGHLLPFPHMGGALERSVPPHASLKWMGGRYGYPLLIGTFQVIQPTQGQAVAQGNASCVGTCMGRGVLHHVMHRDGRASIKEPAEPRDAAETTPLLHSSTGQDRRYHSTAVHVQTCRT